MKKITSDYYALSREFELHNFNPDHLISHLESDYMASTSYNEDPIDLIDSNPITTELYDLLLSTYKKVLHEFMAKTSQFSINILKYQVLTKLGYSFKKKGKQSRSGGIFRFPHVIAMYLKELEAKGYLEKNPQHPKVYFIKKQLIDTKETSEQRAQLIAKWNAISTK